MVQLVDFNVLKFQLLTVIRKRPNVLPTAVMQPWHLFLVMQCFIFPDVEWTSVA